MNLDPYSWWQFLNGWTIAVFDYSRWEWRAVSLEENWGDAVTWAMFWVDRIAWAAVQIHQAAVEGWRILS